MDIGEALSQRIFQLSIKYDKTFYEISKISGIPKTTLREIALGHSKNPKIDKIEKIATAFNISLSDFFDDEIFK